MKITRDDLKFHVKIVISMIIHLILAYILVKKLWDFIIFTHAYLLGFYVIGITEALTYDLFLFYNRRMIKLKSCKFYSQCSKAGIAGAKAGKKLYEKYYVKK